MQVKALDIFRLYTQVFGDGVGLPFPLLDVVPGQEQEPPLTGDFNFKSPYGGNYHLPVRMGSGPNKEDQYQLPNEPLMSWKGGKMLKVTPIRRGKGRGTVKEERGLKDYEITIRGLAINEDNNEYPEDQVKQIRKICEAEGVIYIKSYLTDLFNIQKVSVKDFDFTRVSSNSIRVQPYVIQLVSDMDFEDYRAIIQGG